MGIVAETRVQDAQLRENLDGASGRDGGTWGSDATGVRALMLAVLEDGLRAYLSRSRLLAAEAEHWLFSASRKSPFTFLVLCDVFGLDPEALRQRLLILRKQGVSPRHFLPRVRHNVRSVTRVRLRRRRRAASVRLKGFKH
ncbi:MAG: hypothetical protein KatS3mg077_0119 [Candidatus Binatia bacterium]|nr:MAG: hypothetical protein KatS3mg077_0119 [Candidatus Binatia bacterium]